MRQSSWKGGNLCTRPKFWWRKRLPAVRQQVPALRENSVFTRFYRRRRRRNAPEEIWSKDGSCEDLRVLLRRVEDVMRGYVAKEERRPCGRDS